MKKQIKELILTNAEEQSWLPDLLFEYLSTHKRIEKDSAIEELTDAIMELAAQGIIGVCSHVFGGEESYMDLSVPETFGAMKCSSHWAYGGKNARVFSLYIK